MINVGQGTANLTFPIVVRSLSSDVSSAAVFDQYMQLELGLGLELDRSMTLTWSRKC